MLNEQKNAIISLFNQALEDMGVTQTNVLLERPKVAAHGDLACNVAMQLARQLKTNPRAIATELVNRIQSQPQCADLIEGFEIAGPGFINMRLSQNAKTFAVREVLRLGSNFGHNTDHDGEKILIEYVSANPTGPLHLGHARQGALGDVLSNLMKAKPSPFLKMVIKAFTLKISPAIFLIKRQFKLAKARASQLPETSAIRQTFVLFRSLT